jgi:hypothetical protein
MSRLEKVIRWAGINAYFLGASLLTVGALVAIYPGGMLDIFGRWASLLAALGARTGSEFASQSEMFTHVLQRNAIAALVYFVIGLLLQAPLAMIFGGAFYGFIAFLAPLTIGRPFGPLDWTLVAVEAAALILSASLATALAGDLYDVAPTVRDWWRYSKRSWRTLSLRPPRPWRSVIRDWGATLIVGIATITAVLVLVAWYEIYGY